MEIAGELNFDGGTLLRSTDFHASITQLPSAVENLNFFFKED